MNTGVAIKESMTYHVICIYIDTNIPMYEIIMLCVCMETCAIVRNSAIH